jgi:hypothetical protein
MSTVIQFCKWAGDQRRAAKKLKVSESVVSRAVAAGRFSVKMAKRAEKVSKGQFRAAELAGL